MTLPPAATRRVQRRPRVPANGLDGLLALAESAAIAARFPATTWAGLTPADICRLCEAMPEGARAVRVDERHFRWECDGLDPVRFTLHPGYGVRLYPARRHRTARRVFSKSEWLDVLTGLGTLAEVGARHGLSSQVISYYRRRYLPRVG